MSKLLYTGKSNKNFTHNKLYSYSGYSDQFKDYLWDSSEHYLNVDVKSNNGLIRFNNDYYDYFFKNFRRVDEKEEKKIERANKLKKIKQKNL